MTVAVAVRGRTVSGLSKHGAVKNYSGAPTDWGLQE